MSAQGNGSEMKEIQGGGALQPVQLGSGLELVGGNTYTPPDPFAWATERLGWINLAGWFHLTEHAIGFISTHQEGNNIHSYSHICAYICFSF